MLDNMSIVIDTKQDLQECVNNICGAEHERFRRECLLAQENGIKLIVLVEEDQTDDNGRYVVNSLADVKNWYNPRRSIFVRKNINGTWRRVQKYPNATNGNTLMKAMITMQTKYGVEFQFCRKKDAGRRIIELLRGTQDEERE